MVEFDIDQYKYTATLASKDGHTYFGSYECREGAERWKGSASGEVFWNQDGAVLLGEWTEDGDTYRWSMRLDEVTSFEDEKPKPKPSSRPSPM